MIASGTPITEVQKLCDVHSALFHDKTKTEISDKLLAKLREIAIHYAKKGDLLYPHLKVKYGISGPSDVMWTHDD